MNLGVSTWMDLMAIGVDILSDPPEPTKTTSTFLHPLQFNQILAPEINSTVDQKDDEENSRKLARSTNAHSTT